MKFIDLFCGIGGFRLAFEGNGLNCVFSSDSDKNCQNVYNSNFGEIPVGDIKQVSPNDIPDFDILTAGFPCQPFSYAGKKEGFEDKDQGNLFFYILDILKSKKPHMFLLENVKGLKSHKLGETLKIIQESLIDLDYTIYSHVLNSYEFGVPQNRERWYCVGFDKEIFFEFPNSLNNKTRIKDIVELGVKDESLNLKPYEKHMIEYHFRNMKHRLDRVKHDYEIPHLNTGKKRHGIYSYLKPDGTLRFHVGDVAKSQLQDWYYVSLESVAPAIIATREPKMWDLSRRMSLLECLRLQGFPDDFKMNISVNQAKRLLGNSVTVPVISEIAKKMLLYYELSISGNLTSDNMLFGQKRIRRMA